jgi:hypothetical protein
MAFLELSKESKPIKSSLANGDEYEFKFGKQTEVPTLVAVGYLGSEGYKVTFDLSDKEVLAGASDWTIDLLKSEFNVVGDKEDLIKKMFPMVTKKKIIKTVKKVSVPTVKKTVVKDTKEEVSTDKVDKAIASSEE